MAMVAPSSCESDLAWVAVAWLLLPIGEEDSMTEPYGRMLALLASLDATRQKATGSWPQAAGDDGAEGRGSAAGGPATGTVGFVLCCAAVSGSGDCSSPAARSCGGRLPLTDLASLAVRRVREWWQAPLGQIPRTIEASSWPKTQG